MGNGYWLTLTDDEENEIGKIMMDGRDLRKQSDRQTLAADIQNEMGEEHVEACADLPGLDD